MEYFYSIDFYNSIWGCLFARNACSERLFLESGTWVFYRCFVSRFVSVLAPFLGVGDCRISLEYYNGLLYIALY